MERTDKKDNDATPHEVVVLELLSSAMATEKANKQTGCFQLGGVHLQPVPPRNSAPLSAEEAGAHCDWGVVWGRPQPQQGELTHTCC